MTPPKDSQTNQTSSSLSVRAIRESQKRDVFLLYLLGDFATNIEDQGSDACPHFLCDWSEKGGQTQIRVHELGFRVQGL